MAGRGTQPTRHVYSGDVTGVLVRMVEGLAPRQAAYNLCQPDIVPLRALIERVALLAGVAPRLIDVSWEELQAAGLDRDVAPYSGSWCSLVDPSRAAGEWGFGGTRLEEYLPGVVRWHLEHRPTRSHDGYAHRAREIELAQRLATAGSRA
jgi:nucleoside-diphosphate-sugar epimerase